MRSQIVSLCFALSLLPACAPTAKDSTPSSPTTEASDTIRTLSCEHYLFQFQLAALDRVQFEKLFQILGKDQSGFESFQVTTSNEGIVTLLIKGQEGFKDQQQASLDQLDQIPGLTGACHSLPRPVVESLEPPTEMVETLNQTITY